MPITSLSNRQLAADNWYPATGNCVCRWLKIFFFSCFQSFVSSWYIFLFLFFAREWVLFVGILLGLASSTQPTMKAPTGGHKARPYIGIGSSA